MSDGVMGLWRWYRCVCGRLETFWDPLHRGLRQIAASLGPFHRNDYNQRSGRCCYILVIIDFTGKITLNLASARRFPGEARTMCVTRFFCAF